MLDKTLYENDTNSSVSADTFSEAYIGLLYAKNEVVTKAEFTELTNQFAEAQKKRQALSWEIKRASMHRRRLWRLRRR